ncbi:MAG: helix-turn-helix transcriptional regulator [Lachnospiraceae bacterium]
MIELLKIGENTYHDGNFHVDRPNGYPVYLLIFVKTRGHFLIDSQWITAEPNTAFLFKPYQTHRYHGIDSSYIDSWAHLNFQNSLLNRHFPFGQPITIHNPHDYDSLFHIICNEFYGSKPHRDSILNSLLSAMLEKLSDESNTASYPAIYYDLSEVRKYIYSHPDKEHSIEELSAGLGISVGYFHSLYRRFFNTTCINDVIKSRLQSAAEFLRSTDLGIEDIAIRCGYNHTEHFIRQFKKEYGTTPNKYRKELI